MTRRPADFSPAMRRLIAERAGYRCSKPDCRRQTLGPGMSPREVACIGVACHIHSAAPKGPRGTGGLTVTQLQSGSNGIWLCADHARLIDTNQGRGFPAPLLRGWRQLHEAFLIHEMRGLVPPCALITEINVRQGPGALSTRPIALSAHNIITGNNNTGKTTLLNLLAIAGLKQPFSRFPRYGDLAADIHWFDPASHLVELRSHDSSFTLRQDGKDMPCMSPPYRAVTVKTPIDRPSGVSGWARLLDLDETAFVNLLREVPQRVRGHVSHVDIVGHNPVIHLNSIPRPVRFDETPANGADAIVLLETAIALAQVHRQTGPALLLIDDFGDFLHPVLVPKMLRTLREAAEGIQTIAVTHHLLPPEVRRDWNITTFAADDSLLDPALCPFSG